MTLKEPEKGDVSAPRVHATPEMQLLLCCARPQMSASAVRAVRDLLARSLDWERLLMLANAHGLRPLLYWHLRDREAEVPDNVLRRLQRFFLQNAARSLQWTHELAEIIRLLERNGITAVPYKGPALAVQLYGNVALREWCDLDLMVRPADRVAARRLLIERGYHLRHDVPDAADDFTSGRRHSDVLESEKGFSVELHWAFIERALGQNHNVDYAFTRLKPLSAVGAAMKVFSDLDLVLALAAHGSKHRWTRLEWLAGFAELVQSMEGSVEWGAVALTARRTHRQRVLLLAILLADELIGTSVPPALLDRARADRAVGRLAREVRAVLLEERVLSPDPRRWPAVSIEWFKFRTVDGVGNRLRFIIDRATTPSRAHDVKLISVAGRAVPVAALTRPARLLGKLLRTTWGSEADGNDAKASNTATSGKR